MSTLHPPAPLAEAMGDALASCVQALLLVVPVSNIPMPVSVSPPVKIKAEQGAEIVTAEASDPRGDGGEVVTLSLKVVVKIYCSCVRLLGHLNLFTEIPKRLLKNDRDRADPVSRASGRFQRFNWYGGDGCPELMDAKVDSERTLFSDGADRAGCLAAKRGLCADTSWCSVGGGVGKGSGSRKRAASAYTALLY